MHLLPLFCPLRRRWLRLLRLRQLLLLPQLFRQWWRLLQLRRWPLSRRLRPPRFRSQRSRRPQCWARLVPASALQELCFPLQDLPRLAAATARE